MPRCRAAGRGLWKGFPPLRRHLFYAPALRRTVLASAGLAVLSCIEVPFTLLDYQALGGGGVGGAEGEEVGAGGVLGKWKLEVERCDFGVEEFAACGVGEGH